MLLDLSAAMKQQHLTDYYLDKILPIQNFSHTLKIARTVVCDVDQLKELQRTQEEFFT